jgi:hypothetical protein
VGTAAGVSLCGIAFDNAGVPTISVTGRKKILTKKTTATIKGKATSLLPLTVSAKGAKTAKVARGKWTLNVKLKRGRNVVKLTCADGFGQKALSRVTIIRN